MKKTDVLFHETFPPQAEYLSSLIRLAAEPFEGSKEEISEITGIPTGKQKGKVVPHIKYANYMGLVSYSENNKRFTLQLTDLGRLVLENDPFLFENITKQICHYNLSDPERKISLWSSLLHRVPHKLDAPIGIAYAKDKLLQEYGFQVEIGVVKSSYDGGFFDSLDFVDWSDKEICYRHSFITEQNVELYAYTLLQTWESVFPQNNEITIHDIIEVMMWGTAYGFDMDDVIMALDLLEQKRYVQLNRQLYPLTIARLQTSATVLKNLYANMI